MGSVPNANGAWMETVNTRHVGEAQIAVLAATAMQVTVVFFSQDGALQMSPAPVHVNAANGFLILTMGYVLMTAATAETAKSAQAEAVKQPAQAANHVLVVIAKMTAAIAEHAGHVLALNALQTAATVEPANIVAMD